MIRPVLRPVLRPIDGGARIRLSRAQALRLEEEAETRGYLDTTRKTGSFGMTLGEALRNSRAARKRERVRRRRPVRAGLLGVLALVLASAATADPVIPRFPEGGTHAFLVLSAVADGRTLAHGEVVAVPRGNRVQSRLVWRFRDGSFQDETSVFEVRPALRLFSFKQVQRGRAFPADVEVSFSREPGEYRIVRRERGKKESEELTGTLQLPPDTYNGMLGTVLRNLPPGATGTGHMVAFTPKPRMIKMTMRPIGEDSFLAGDQRRVATRFLIDLEIGGIAGIFASIAGKEPPDLRYWLVKSEVPTFVKFEGPFFLDGPLWRIEVASPRWTR